MNNTKSVSYWLYICCAAILIMVAIGGLTRLTDSGLSIMKWEPLSGTIPPLSESEWHSYFDEYKKIPEFETQNKWMKLDDFKGIFWLEYIHRLWGRVIGLILIVPLVYFAVKKTITPKFTKRMLLIFALGGLQGFIGWYMVSSGFVEKDSVSQYRLAIHLGFAILLFGAIYWTARDLMYINNVTYRHFSKSFLSTFAVCVTALIFLQLILGAFVAGTHAGYVNNDSFPLMNGKLIPDGIYSMHPWWVNHFENLTMVQFQHRMLGMLLTVLVVIFVFLYVKTDYNNFPTGVFFIVAIFCQIVFGVLTLKGFATYADYDLSTHAYKKALYFPVVIAAIHQINGIFVFAISLHITHKLLRN
jgi:cytochrome c oxidase assembly protein subunit 15